jgi:hypothetical protein
VFGDSGPATRSRDLAAEDRFSNELACTIGCEPATVSFAVAAGAFELPESDGFNDGWAAACLVSDFGAIFDADASGCCGSWCLASLILGFAATERGWGGAPAVASAVAPPRPTLWARRLKKPSECASDAAEAAWVEEVVPGAIDATSGSSGEVTGPRGGLTVAGMVPGGRDSANDCPGSPASDSPVLPLGTLAANTRFMPPSIPVFNRATGVPRAISLAISASSACSFARTGRATSSGMT